MVWGVFTERTPRTSDLGTKRRDFYIALLQLWDREDPEIAILGH